MKLQDYLHYYLGCEVIVDGKERAKFIGGSFVPNSCNQIYYDLQTEEMKVDDIDFAMPYNDDADDPEPRVKPLLRRLEDMTEDEFIEVVKIVDTETSGDEIKKYYPSFQQNGMNQMSVSEGDFCKVPAVIHYFLTRRFDLFGLIPAGLAIDIKTIDQ